MQKISITRALANIKLLDKRIRKKINTSIFIKIKQTNENTDLISKEIKSDNRSINDLIKERNKLKKLIMISNANTKVNIAGVTMSVQEAIERKNSIEYEEYLLEELKRQYSNIASEVEKINSLNTERFDQLINSNFSKDIKANNQEYQALYNTFWESNKTEVIDPLNLKEVIDKLSEFIDSFNSEIDLVLSESNARTEIEI